MAAPSFLRPRRTGTVITAPSPFSIGTVDVLGVMNAYMETWNTNLRALEAAIATAPPGPGKDLAELLGDRIADGISKFKDEAFLKSTLAAAYAAIA